MRVLRKLYFLKEFQWRYMPPDGKCLNRKNLMGSHRHFSPPG